MKTNLVQNQSFFTAKSLLPLLVAGTVVAVTLGALNGGTALTTGTWDGLVTTIKDMLASTWVYALALIALLVCVWQISHGKGYGGAATVLGLLAVALVGPTLTNSIATASGVAPVAISPGTPSALSLNPSAVRLQP